VVRDAMGWADQLTESIRMFGDSDVMITSHAWPRFGRAEIGDYLAKHRDAYAFLHDQTVRLMNDGLTGPEIAARLKLPPALEREWYDRPYYGSFSFNSRAVYQRYMGWYDANPVHLAPRPPEDTAKRYVAALGVPTKVRSLAREAYDAGDYAWAAELLDKAVFADPKDAAAKTLLARSYEQLAWQSENSLWRNMYLTGASELRNGVPTQQGIAAAQGGLVANLPTHMVFDLMSVRLDADKVGDGKVRLAFVFTDRKETVYVTVENGVLIHQPINPPGPVDATLTISRADFLQSVLGGAPLAPKVASGAAKIDGDAGALQRFASWMSPPRGNFAIVTP
jgi:alkyl sulfatase BDS1-like metallo-beta-lactamase superfamily hydrolase